MDVSLNNISRDGLYLFDGIPSIVEFSSLGYTASGAQLAVRVTTVTPADGYTLTVNGETVTSVVSQSDAGPRQFGTNCSAEGLANNICRALSSIPSIVSSYSVSFNDRGYVILKALGSGSATAITYSSDIPDVEFEYTPPSPSSSAATADVTVSRSSPPSVAVLSKSVVSDIVRFNISDVLSGMSDEGKAVPVTVGCHVTDAEGDVTRLREFHELVVQGWHDRSHPDFLASGGFIAQNMKGAPDRDVYNNVVLYALQGSDVGVPWLPSTTGSTSASYAVYDSAFNSLTSGGLTETMTANEISQFTVPGSATLNASAWYLSVTLPDSSVVRYNLIRSGMSSGCVRLYWRNSMGGVSFFDFTGEMSEKTDISSEYMYDEGSSYGYYTDEYRHDELVYSQKAEKTYTVQSHIIEEAGCPIVDDLASSRKVWVERDGRKHLVLVTAVEKVKVASNGTWRLKVSFKYSVNE